MRLPHLFFFAFAVVFINSCVLQREEENFVVVKSEFNPNNVGELLAAGHPVKDTVWLDREVNFTLSAKSVNRCVVLINDQILTGTQYSSFTLRRDVRAPGIYKLTLNLSLHSDTGSLADKMGAELVDRTLNYVLVVGPSTFVPAITNIKTESGDVIVSWKRYGKGNFVSYKIRKYSLNETIPFRTLLVTAQSQMSLKDTTYAGNFIRYELTVETSSGEFKASPYTFYAPYLPQLTLSKVSDTRSRLSWIRPPFSNNVKYYTVKQGTTILADRVDANATSVEFNQASSFGDYKTFSITITSKAVDPVKPGPDFANIEEFISLGKRAPLFKRTIYNSAKNAFYVVDRNPYYSDYFKNGLYKLDGTSLDVVKSIEYTSFQVSGINDYVMSPNASYFYLISSGNLKRINANDLSSMETVSLAGYNLFVNDNIDFTPKDSHTITDSGFILLSLAQNTHIINLTNNTKVLSVPSNGLVSHLANDNQRAVVGSKLYSYNSTSFVLDTTLPYADIQYLKFLDSQPSKLLIVTGTKAVLYDCTSHTEISSTPYTPAFDIHFDQSSSLLYSNRTTLNILTGEFKTRTNSSGTFTIEGNTIFISSISTCFATKLD